MDVAAGGQTRTLYDFITPGVQDISPTIARPTMKVNNFELRLVLVSKFQQMQFGGSPMEDLNLHLSIFLKVCDTLKLNGVSTDAIRLCLFSFSLKVKHVDGFIRCHRIQSRHGMS